LLGAVSLPVVGPVGSVAIISSSYGYNLRMVSPMITLNYLSIAAQEGLLIKDGRALEKISKVDTVVFDKTGTLTISLPHFEKIHFVNQCTFSENELLTLAAAAEHRQSHPIAIAILSEARKRQLILPKANHTKIELGYGISTHLNRRQVHLGSARFMEMSNIYVSEVMNDLAEEMQERGHSMVYLAIDGMLEGIIELRPAIRPESKEVIQYLQNKGIECIIISGDHTLPTRRLAQELGITTYYSEVMPAEKANLVSLLQRQNRTVCFIGDGINDSIALKRADVSISLNGATTIATDTAQIILMDESLHHIPLLFELGKEFDKTMKRNFYQAVAISSITIGGIFVFNFGIITSILANQISLWLGMGRAISPVLAYQNAIKERRGKQRNIAKYKRKKKEEQKEQIEAETSQYLLN